jgi:hypothetical protein
MWGDETALTAIASPEGEKVTLRPVLFGLVDGSANLVPKPEPDQG